MSEIWLACFSFLAVCSSFTMLALAYYLAKEAVNRFKDGALDRKIAEYRHNMEMTRNCWSMNGKNGKDD